MSAKDAQAGTEDEFGHGTEPGIIRTENYKRRGFTWKKAIILAAALVATLSVMVTAAVNYVRQRMEAMNEAERTSHF